MAIKDYLLLTIVFILLAIIVKGYIWERRWLYYHSLRFKGLIGLPLIGSVPIIMGAQNIYELVKRLSEQYQDIFKFWLGERLIITSTRPKDVETVMKSCLEKDSYLYESMNALAGNSLLTAELTRWKKHRKMARPTLSKMKVQAFVDIFSRHTENLVKKLEEKCDKGIFDIKYFLHTTAVNMASDTLMDSRIESEERILEIASWMNRLMKLSSIRAFFSGWMFAEFLWQLTPFAKEFDTKRTILRNVVKELMTKKENDETKKTSLLFHINETTKMDETWSFEDKTDLCQTLLIGASDTISSELCFIVTALGIHKDIQEKVYQEQVSIFDSSKRNPTTEDLNQMVYLEQVINETLRLFPVAPIFGRAIRRDIQLDDDYILPKGCIFLTSVMAIHRDPKYWPEPLKFDPNRFRLEEIRKRPANIFLPFSIGARNCIGIHYALVAMKVVMSKLVRHFKIISELKSLEDIRLHFEVVTQMEDGCQIAIEPRMR